MLVERGRVLLHYPALVRAHLCAPGSGGVEGWLRSPRCEACKAGMALHVPAKPSFSRPLRSYKWHMTGFLTPCRPCSCSGR